MTGPTSVQIYERGAVKVNFTGPFRWTIEVDGKTFEVIGRIGQIDLAEMSVRVLVAYPKGLRPALNRYYRGDSKGEAFLDMLTHALPGGLAEHIVTNPHDLSPELEEFLWNSTKDGPGVLSTFSVLFG